MRVCDVRIQECVFQRQIVIQLLITFKERQMKYVSGFHLNPSNLATHRLLLIEDFRV